MSTLTRLMWIKANAAVVSAGSGGAISAFVTDTTDLIIDINGNDFVTDSSQLTFFILYRPVVNSLAHDNRPARAVRPGQPAAQLSRPVE